MSTDFISEMTVEVTKEKAPLAPPEQLGTYHLKRWTWYEKQKALSQASVVTDVKRGIFNVSVHDFYVGALAVMVREVPETLKEAWGNPEARVAYIKERMDADVGDLLRNSCMKLTNPDEKSFLQLSEQKTLTLG